MCGGVEMATRARAEVGGLEFESPHLHLFSPNKQLYPDFIVPVPITPINNFIPIS